MLNSLTTLLNQRLVHGVRQTEFCVQRDYARVRLGIQRGGCGSDATAACVSAGGSYGPGAASGDTALASRNGKHAEQL